LPEMRSSEIDQGADVVKPQFLAKREWGFLFLSTFPFAQTKGSPVIRSPK